MSTDSPAPSITSPSLRPRRWIAGLRQRLTLSFVLLFSLILLILGWAFYKSLAASLARQNRTILEEEWAALRGYLQIDPATRRVSWVYHADDSEEAYIVERLRRVLLITDLRGEVLEISNGYRALTGPGHDSAFRSEIEMARRSAQPRVVTLYRGRTPYLVRQGIIKEAQQEYFLAIGFDVSDSEIALREFIRTYLLLAPAFLLITALIGWLLAERSLAPLRAVAEAVQQLSLANLSLRVPERGTGDELDLLIRKFNETAGRLEESVGRVRQFSIDASHELRTPLTAIRGQLEVALLSARNEQQYRDAIASALEDVQRLSQVVKSLLLLSQAESGQITLAKTRVNAALVVNDIFQTFRLGGEEKGLQLLTDLPPAAFAVLDRTQFERLVSSLLSNAIKFTPAPGTVRVALEQAPGRIILTVSDTGPGIPREYHTHIYEHFFRVVHSERDKEKGFGLGLAFVAWIVKAHQGTIELTSDQGNGASFKVTLPTGLSDEESPSGVSAPADVRS